MTAKKTYTNPDTILAVAGRDPDNNFGIVNPPVYHASTILSPTMAKFENRIPFEGFGYGRNGTPKARTARLPCSRDSPRSPAPWSASSRPAITCC
jgi:cystathionine beta-lyase/cystathionine gamma-synthase